MTLTGRGGLDRKPDAEQDGQAPKSSHQENTLATQ